MVTNDRKGVTKIIVLLCAAYFAAAEKKDCDPKKDSGCMKFIRPFYPDECWAAFPGGPNCTRFDPMKSKSLKYVDKGIFLLQYADNSALKGYEARDIVQLGDYYTFTKFGGITVCNSPDFQRVNGILGFGLPQQQHMMLPDGTASPALPAPLLFDLTSHKEGVDDKLLPRRAFSFLSSDSEAEIQLGGVDPASIIGDMQITSTVQPNDYSIAVHSVRFGKQELLKFKDPSLKIPEGCKGNECMSPYLVGILDTGTSCLVLPDAEVPGMLTNRPFTDWKTTIGGNTKEPKVKESFWINIAGREYEIPYDDWYITKGSDADQSCVQRFPGGMPMLLIGDVFFRRFVVMFDLTTFPGPVTIGIGKRHPDYQLASHHEYVTKIQATKTVPQVIMETRMVNPKYLVGVAEDRVHVVNHDNTQFFVNVSIGTPRQTMPVIFDTGSSVFGVFSRCMSKGVATQIGLPGIQCDFGQASDSDLATAWHHKPSPPAPAAPTPSASLHALAVKRMAASRPEALGLSPSRPEDSDAPPHRHTRLAPSPPPPPSDAESAAPHGRAAAATAAAAAAAAIVVTAITAALA